MSAPCLLGARLNAFRLNYVDARIWIWTSGGGWLGGAGAPAGVLVESLAIGDRLTEAPNTCLLTVRGARPIEGNPIRITIGSQAGTALFAGRILRVTRVWGADNPAHVLYHVEATDPTWDLAAVTLSRRYENQSASTIGADLVARYAAALGFHGVIDPGLPTIDVITMSNVTVVEAFAQVARRMGGYSFVDYDYGIHLYTAAAGHVAPPRPLRPDHPSLAGVSYGRDLTQIVTRAIVEGGGGTAIATVPVGGGIVPVDVISWYSAGGGIVRSGPQRIRYAGIVAGGAGAFAGTGVSPTTAPTVTATVGTSPVELGAHGYAYTWLTSVGETLPGPVVTVTLGVGGVVAPLLPAPVPRANVASGLVIGTLYVYSYAWSYVDADTDVSQVSKLSDPAYMVCQPWTQTSGVAAPAAALTVANYAAGAIAAGAHSWAYTWVTATGESTPAPLKAWTLATLPTPTVATSFYATNANNYVAEQPGLGFVAGATVRYAMSTNAANRPPVAGDAVSALGPMSAPVTIVAGGPAGYVHEVILQTGGGTYGGFPFYYMSINGGPWYWANNGVSTGLVSVGGPHAEVPLLAPAPVGQVLLSAIAVGPAAVTARKIYRTPAGGSDLRLVTTIANNSATTYVDTLADTGLGPAAPAIDATDRPGGFTFGNYGGAWDPLAKRLLVFRYGGGLPGYYRVAALPVGHAWSGAYWDGLADATVLADPATYPLHPNTATGTIVTGRATIAGVAPGPATVVARRIYRTAAGGSQLKLLTEFSDNTTTALPGYDTAPDAALGFNAPTVDTAGVVAPARIVPAGATDLPVTSTAPFADAGGYVRAGNQVIRHGGRSSTALTGIPATGDGAIAASIAYGTPVTVAAALVGIAATGAGAIVYPVRAGDPVNLVAIVDDAAAQAALAAAVGGGDGVREGILADGRIGLTEATARGRALLAQHSTVREAVAYRSRDYATRSGALVAVDLPPPTDVHGSFRVQDVTVARFPGTGAAPPVFEARASSDRFTFEDWVRRLADSAAAPATGETR